MDKGLYVAMTGASATLKAQAGVAHNLANIDTIGFKAELAIASAHVVEGPGWRSRFDAELERGKFDDSAGPLIDSGNPLDVAMRPGFWMAVADTEGKEAYTRAGDLKLTANGQLVTGSGAPVLDQSGAPIAVPPYASITLAQDGTVSIVPLGQSGETTATLGRIKMVEAGASNLTRGVDGLMRADGALEAASGGTLDSGVLEASNVGSGQMLVQMIELSRRFEMQIKMIRSVEENAQASNALLRLG
jgi:flagellar basal-body rod protein FlgF